LEPVPVRTETYDEVSIRLRHHSRPTKPNRATANNEKTATGPGSGEVVVLCIARLPTPGAEQPNDLLDNFCSRFLLEYSRLSLKQLKIGRKEPSGPSVAYSLQAPFCKLIIRELDGIRIRVWIARHLIEHKVIPTNFRQHDSWT
jgi:hypothetical protein